MIDTKLLTFIEVVNCKSMTQAAKHLHLTQPAVSQQIKQLENDYDHELILATHNKFQLTKAGEMLFVYAKTQYQNEQTFLTQLNGIDTPITIGATLSIADYYLSTILAPYTYKTSSFKIEVGNTQTLIKKMLDGEVNCAFVEGQFDTSLFDYHLWKEEKFILVVNHNHPLAHKHVQLQDLLSYPILIREKGSGTRAILEHYLKQSLYQIQSFQKMIEVGSQTLIKQLLLQTQGITFCYKGVVEQELASGELVEVTLQDFHFTKPMHFIYLKNSINKEYYQKIFESIQTSDHLKIEKEILL